MFDHYRTIKTEVTEGSKVKGSRFIGRSSLVATVEEAQAALEKIRKIEYQATHNCYAYLVGIEEQTRQFKYSDDGEPGGTAGRPIYDVIAGSELTNLLIVVTRYYGGTKLGTGGLVRAYSDAAKQTLLKSQQRDNYLTTKFVVSLSFPFYDTVVKQLAVLDARQVDAEFTEEVKLTLEIRSSQADRLIEVLTEATNGKVKIEKQT